MADESKSNLTYQRHYAVSKPETVTAAFMIKFIYYPEPQNKVPRSVSDRLDPSCIFLDSKNCVECGKASSDPVYCADC